jgi:HEAT repeat protein
LEVVSYILRQGKLTGRRIAAQALSEFEGPDANQLAVLLLEDDDPQVRAAAAGQLRARNVPGAIQRLLQLLDSPHPAEREAAQAGLVEFTLERFSANFDQLTPEARAMAGALVRRVDPQSVDRIRAELDAPARGRKKRALELAVALDAVAQLQTQIAGLLKDEDHYLRIDAIRTLATINNPLARQTLRDALLDSQPLVQQAAQACLLELSRGDTVANAADATDSIRDTVRFAAAASHGNAAPSAACALPAAACDNLAEVTP